MKFSGKTCCWRHPDERGGRSCVFVIALFLLPSEAVDNRCSGPTVFADSAEFLVQPIQGIGVLLQLLPFEGQKLKKIVNSWSQLVDFSIF